MTFWGTEFFKSIDNNEVRYGENVSTYIQWPVDVEEGQEPESGFVNTLLVTSLAVCGPLLMAL